jgi:asparagine synthase (glutamine-hydrolysing)
VGYNWIDNIEGNDLTKLVTAEQRAGVNETFPITPPLNTEEYYYRTIFAAHFPSGTAAACVPSVPSVACSTPIALEWDEAFRKNADPSGRAVAGVHEQAI